MYEFSLLLCGLFRTSWLFLLTCPSITYLLSSEDGEFDVSRKLCVQMDSLCLDLSLLVEPQF